MHGDKDFTNNRSVLFLMVLIIVVVVVVVFRCNIVNNYPAKSRGMSPDT